MRHKTASHDSRVPDSVCACGEKGNKTKEPPKICTITVVVFPWLASLCFGCAVLS